MMTGKIDRARLILLALALTMSSPASADCTSDIRAVLDRLKSTTPVRQEMTTRGAGGTVTTLTENDLPRALRVRTQGGERGVTETIIVGDSVWRGNGHEWRQSDPEIGKQIATQIREQVTKATPTIENAVCGATGTLEGKQLQIYTYEQSFAFMTAAGKATAKLYVDPATGLAIRQDVKSRAAGAESSSITHISYDKSINITAPSP